MKCRWNIIIYKSVWRSHLLSGSGISLAVFVSVVINTGTNVWKFSLLIFHLMATTKKYARWNWICHFEHKKNTNERMLWKKCNSLKANNSSNQLHDAEMRLNKSLSLMVMRNRMSGTCANPNETTTTSREQWKNKKFKNDIHFIQCSSWNLNVIYLFC